MPCHHHYKSPSHPRKPDSHQEAGQEAVAHIEVRELDLRYGPRLIMEKLTFSVRRGEIFAVMGESGCGKSTLLRYLVGLLEPLPGQGDILYHGESFCQAAPERRAALLRHFGVLYQGGALWSSMTLAENVALPLEEYTTFSPGEIRELVEFRLALVGLGGSGNLYPAEISGGMRKRAALARAMALDPEILFFDEPSAGLDPLSARRLDELILQLRETLNATVVIVTHELASIFDIADNAIFLDAGTRRLLAQGKPADLLAHSPELTVRQFLSRGAAGG